MAIGYGAKASNIGDIALGRDSVTAAAVTTGSGTIAGNAYTYAGVAGSTLSIGAGGTERSLTNLAAGRVTNSSTDAVNGSQLFATHQAIDALSTAAASGWSLSASGANPSDVGAGETVDLKNGDANLVVSKSAANNDVTFDLADDVTIANSLTVGNNVFGQDGFTSANLSVNSTGANYTGPITAGTHLTNKDYVDQAVTTVNNAVNAGWTLTAEGQNGSAVKPNDAVDMASADGNLAISKTAASNDINFSLADDVTIANSLTVGNNVFGQDGFTSANLSVDSTGANYTGPITAGTHLTNKDYVDQAVTTVNNAVNSGWTLTAEGQNGSAVKPNDAVDMASADGNLAISKTAASNDINFSLADDVTIANSLTVGNNVFGQDGFTSANLSVNSTGANYTGPITDGSHIANKAYVDDAMVAASGDVNLGFGANIGDELRRTNGQSISVLGEATTEGEYSGANLRTVTDSATGAIQLQMAIAPKFGDVTINEASSGRITGVANGLLSETSNHVVNGSQLVAFGNSMAQGFGGGSTYDYANNAFKPQLSVGNTVYNNIQDALNAAIAEAGKNNGGGGGGGGGGSDGWFLESGNTDRQSSTPNNSHYVNAGDTVAITGGDNMQVTQEGGNIKIGLNPDLKNINSIEIVDGPTINGNGINMNGDRITNLADGIDPGDAVNVRQLNAGMAETLIKANNYTDIAIGELGNRLDEQSRNASAATAAAMAIGQLPQASAPGMSSVGMSVSTWDNQQAVAVGYSRSTTDGRFVLRAGGSYNSRNKGGASVGIGYQF